MGLSHTAAAETGIDSGLRTAASDEHNYCSHSSTAQMGVTHAQCCLLMLMGGSVVTSCSLHVLLSACGTCSGLYARERGQQKKKKNYRYVRTK